MVAREDNRCGIAVTGDARRAIWNVHSWSLLIREGCVILAEEYAAYLLTHLDVQTLYVFEFGGMFLKILCDNFGRFDAPGCRALEPCEKSVIHTKMWCSEE